MTQIQDHLSSPPRWTLTGRAVLIALIGFFTVVIGVNVVMIRAATSTFSGVETESAYNAGLAFEEELAAAHEQDVRGWQVNGKIVRAGQDEFQLTLAVRDHDGKVVPGLQVDAHLVHPADTRRDRVIAVTSDAAGTFRGNMQAEPGQWTLEVDVIRDGARAFHSLNKIYLR